MSIEAPPAKARRRRGRYKPTTGGLDGDATWAVAIVGPRGKVLEHIPITTRAAVLFAQAAVERPWARLALVAGAEVEVVERADNNDDRGA